MQPLALEAASISKEAISFRGGAEMQGMTECHKATSQCKPVLFFACTPHHLVFAQQKCPISTAACRNLDVSEPKTLWHKLLL